jgi:tetratricopeptide (TPR) repeat protein
MNHMKKQLTSGATIWLFVLSLPFLCHAGASGNAEIPVTSSSDEAVIFFQQGREAFEMGRITDAVLCFENAVQKDAQFASAWLYKALMSESQDHWKANIDKAAKYRNQVSNGEGILIEIALTYAENDAEKRFQLAKKLAALYPESVRALLILAGEHQARGEIQAFRTLTEDAIGQDPESPLGYRSLAASYLLNEPVDFSLAGEYMQKFLELRPGEASAHIAVGDVNRARIDLLKANDAYSEAILIHPESTTALAKRGYIHTYTGMFDNARADFEKASALRAATQDNNRINGALAAYLFPGTGKTMSQVYAAEETSGSKKSRRISLAGDSDNCYFCCTFISMTHGFYVTPNQTMPACRCLQREFEYESKVPEAKSIEANIAFVEGFQSIQLTDYNKALMKAQEYARIIDPEERPEKNEAYNYLMGLTNFAQGKYYQALNCFGRSDINNICVRFNMGLAYDKLGQVEKAEKMFNDVVHCGFANASNGQMVKIADQWLMSLASAVEKIKK